VYYFKDTKVGITRRFINTFRWR